MCLKDLPVGSKGRIVSFGKEHPEYRRRLVMLGATPGTTFDVVRIAPLGDPIEIRVRGSFISVRRYSLSRSMVFSGILLLDIIESFLYFSPSEDYRTLMV